MQLRGLVVTLFLVANSISHYIVLVLIVHSHHYIPYHAYSTLISDLRSAWQIVGLDFQASEDMELIILIRGHIINHKMVATIPVRITAQLSPATPPTARPSLTLRFRGVQG